MAILPDNSIAAYAAKAGFSGNALAMSVAIALAESGGDTAAKGFNRVGTRVLSTDRGLWQINDKYHPEVTDACAFDATCAAGATYRISSRGADWRPWATFTSGAYRKFLARGLAAASSIASQAPVPAPPPPAAGGASKPSFATTNLLYNVPLSSDANVDVQTLSYGTEGKGFRPYQYVVAWGILLSFLYVIAKTRAGYVAIYYAEVLILLFLFATQFQFFRESLAPILSKSPSGKTGTPTPAAGGVQGIPL